MENTDILILSSIIIVLFIFFLVSIYKEIKAMDNQTYTIKNEGGPRTAIFNILAELADNKDIPIKNKRIINNTLIRTISDMENDGTYFPDDIKKQLIKQKEELHCEYSGLPSPKAYE